MPRLKISIAGFDFFFLIRVIFFFAGTGAAATGASGGSGGSTIGGGVAERIRCLSADKIAICFTDASFCARNCASNWSFN